MKGLLLVSISLVSYWAQAEEITFPSKRTLEGIPLPESTQAIIEKQKSKVPVYELIALGVDNPAVWDFFKKVIDTSCLDESMEFNSGITTPQQVMSFQDKNPEKGQVFTLDKAIEVQMFLTKLEKNQTPCSDLLVEKKFSGPTRAHYSKKIEAKGATH